MICMIGWHRSCVEHVRKKSRKNTMFDAIFEKLRVPLLERALNASSARQRAIADNIANIDTPGYKAKDVNFHKMLEDSSSRIIIGKRTDQRHIAIDEGVIEEDQVEFFENKSIANDNF